MEVSDQLRTLGALFLQKVPVTHSL